MLPVTKKPVAKKVVKSSEENGVPEVESGIEIPTRTRKGTAKYPFASMEVGDSFLTAAEEDDMVRVKSRMSNACAQAQKKLEGYKFSVRQVEGGVRVWRIEPSK